MLELIQNQKQTFNDMMENRIFFQHFINMYFPLLDNNNFYKKIYIIFENNNIHLKKEKSVISMFKTLYERNRNIEFLLTLLISSLEEENLIDMFGTGYKTNKLGEGFKRGYSGRCFFFKLNGFISMYFIDHRGSGLSVASDISPEKFLQFMVDLIELIVTKTDLIEEYKKVFPKYFL
jgi:hypothetical protein